MSASEFEEKKVVYTEDSYTPEQIAQFIECMRFYGDMRFKQLTLFMAVMTAAGAGIGQYPCLKAYIAGIGMLFTGVMWVMEVSSTLYWVEFRKRAKGSWPRPQLWLRRLINATNAVLILYASFYAVWLVCLIRWWPGCVLRLLGFLLGAVLFIYSCVSYMPLWRHEEKT
jgi:hypothetical protein